MKQCLDCNLKSESTGYFYDGYLQLECQKCGSGRVADVEDYILMVTGHRYKRSPETMKAAGKEPPCTKEFIKEKLIEYFLKNGVPTLFINGYAIGVDKMADEICKEFLIPTKQILPDYDTYHYKRAPLVRDEEMVDMSNKLIAFFDGIEAGGAWYTIKYAKDKIETHIVNL